MTASLASPPSSQAITHNAPSARRRMRRVTTVGGAADDCFACAKRNIKCDRARPYCSQCLDVGNGCSGYKTHLTWDVGVASRGRLRGLSLPVAKSPPVRRVAKGVAKGASKGSAKARVPGPTPTTTQARSWPNSRPGSYAIASITSIAPKPGERDRRGDNNNDKDRQLAGKAGAASNYPVRVQHPMSDSPTKTTGAHTFPRDEESTCLPSPPILYNAYAEQAPLLSLDTSSSFTLDSSRTPASCPSLTYSPSEQSASLHLHMPHADAFNVGVSPRMSQDFNFMDFGVYATSTGPHSQPSCWTFSPVDDDSLGLRGISEHHHGSWSSIPSQFTSSPLSQLGVDLFSKMSFLMDYYENVICPSMVLVDTPSNPFRAHILELAVGSASLRHAICALASCNLRLKQRYGHPPGAARAGEGRAGEGRAGSTSPGRLPSENRCQPPSGEPWPAEEYQHRNLAVQLLNDELHDPVRSTHDSALATILMLCHYRMAESGIARFHAQFAGVKKIVAMRRSLAYARGIPLPASATWMEALFTYFDALSASVNDREVELDGSSWSGANVGSDPRLLPAGSENLVGCDRELFETIAKLGRLNMLSQNRPVQSLNAQDLRSPSPPTQPRGGSPPRVTKPKSHEQQQQRQGSVVPPYTACVDGDRGAFWQEWEEAHAALRHWRFDPSRTLASLSDMASPPSHPITPDAHCPPTYPGYPARGGTASPPPPPPPPPPFHLQPHPHSAPPNQLRDLNSLSEAFRCAALVYLERLAGPPPPGSSPPSAGPAWAARLRELVSLALCYAAIVAPGGAAEKFLLWPLFVAGSECTDAAQRGAVRARCADLAARSGYMNTLAALGLLEKAWAATDAAAAAGKDGGSEEGCGLAPVHAGARGSSPFGWTRFMETKDGEVEWIMC